MQHIMKVRPAWKRNNGEQGGAIISIPVSLLRDIGADIGDSLDISVDNGTIVMRRVAAVQ